MTEQNQDPAESENLDTQTETSEGDGELTHGGEGVFSTGDQPVTPEEPENQEAVEVSPAEAPGLLDQFERTEERGYRRKES